uniref:Pupal cuticle protein Edg-78E n=1 Tax=Megaselia scalaris TaxID=36166 RepID=T1H433_MEGSC
MFKIFVAVALFGLVAANHLDKNAELRSFDSGLENDGSFHYSYESSNGIQARQSGNGDRTAGESKYISPEGQTIALRYTADEFGFHPEGDHLPTPPPIPEHILKALEYIRTHPPKEPKSLKVTRRQISSSPQSRRSIPIPSREVLTAPF